jgi:two-component system OmpR family sensor kinase
MTGLRFRLVVSTGVIVIVTLAVAFWVVYHQTGSELKNQLDVTLRNSTSQMVAAIRNGDGSPGSALKEARAFARAQPYARASVLLYAIVPGRGTASNHPELFGSAKADRTEPEAEQHLENAAGRRLAVPHVGFDEQTAPDTGLLRTYETAVRLTQGKTIFVGAAEPVDTIARAQHGVRRTYLLAGGLGVSLALIGAFVAGSRLASPLRRAARTATQVDGGDLSPRMTVPASASLEVQVLGTAFNHMLDRLGDAFDAQREFVADASHELRTPLTVIRGQLDLIAGAPAGEPATEEDRERVRRIVNDEITRMARLTDDLLLLAQSQEDDFLHSEPVPLSEFLANLWDGLSLIADRRFEVGEVPEVTINADPHRLAQALRNLGRNSIQHTAPGTGLVRLDAELIGAQGLRLTVSDNGPGIPAEHRGRIFERFYRTDRARTRAAGGAGLGLAIVKAIAEAHGGTVDADERLGGGTRMVLVLPIGTVSN